MAALTDGFVLTNLPPKSSLLGVERSDVDDCVLVTCKTGFIRSYKISDQKLLQSWSVSHTSRISCPAVWNGQRQQLFTVVNKQIIKIWTNEEKNFEKAHKKHVKSEIYCILSEEGFEPVVVCGNGKVDFFSKIKGSSSEEKLDDKENIEWCQSFKQKNELCLVLVSRTDDELYRAHYFQYQADSLNWLHKVSVLRKLTSASTLSSCCLSKKQEQSLLVLAQTGDIFESSLGLSRNTGEQTKVASIDIQKDASIVALTPSHVAVAGISNKDQYGLGIFDIKFKTLLVWKPFPETIDKKPKLFCQQGCLFLSCSKNLYAFPYECEPSTLVKLLGQQLQMTKGPVSQEQQPVGIVTWSAKSKDIKTSLIQRNENISAILSDLLNKEKTNTLKKFQSVFNSLVNEMSKEPNKIWVASVQMSQLANRCFQETKFWPCDQIRQLVENNLITTRDIPALFDALIAHKEISLIHLSLKTLPDIPESCLVNSLQFYFESSEEDIAAAVDNTQSLPSLPVTYDGISCQINAVKAHLIVLSLPYNDVFLVEYLRNLTFKNTLVLLQYLLYMLKLPRENFIAEVEGMPPFLKVIDWISLLLDTNMSQMVISPDAKILLIHLDEAVTQQVQLYDQLLSLSALLSQMKSMAAVPKKKKVGRYCIEVLHVL